MPINNRLNIISTTTTKKQQTNKNQEITNKPIHSPWRPVHICIKTPHLKRKISCKRKFIY